MLEQFQEPPWRTKFEPSKGREELKAQSRKWPWHVVRTQVLPVRQTDMRNEDRRVFKSQETMAGSGQKDPVVRVL